MQVGDTGTSSGPTYNIHKILQGWFHQANMQLFGEASGIQCACNLLYALCWGKPDLVHILVEGNSLCTSDMLSADGLPELYKYSVITFLFDIVDLKQLSTLTHGDSFLREVLIENTGTTLCLLFMKSFPAAIILSRNRYYLFASQSPHEKGLSTSVIMEFNDLFEIEKYIQVAYLEYRDR